MKTAFDTGKLISACETLRAVAPISHIETEEDYRQATDLLNGLLDIVRDDVSHPLDSLVSVFGDLIEAYEMDQEPLVET